MDLPGIKKIHVTVPIVEVLVFMNKRNKLEVKMFVKLNSKQAVNSFWVIAVEQDELNHVIVNVARPGGTMGLGQIISDYNLEETTKKLNRTSID